MSKPKSFEIGKAHFTLDKPIEVCPHYYSKQFFGRSSLDYTSTSSSSISGELYVA